MYKFVIAYLIQCFRLDVIGWWFPSFVEDLSVSNEWLLAAVFLTLLLFTKLDLVVLVLMECLLSFQIPHLRPAEYKRSRLSRNRRTVNRAYGGVLSGSAVRERYDTLMVSCFFLLFEVMETCFKWFWCVYYAELSEPSWWRSKRLWKRFWRSRSQRKN